MNLGIIVAVSENDVIGKDGELPWDIPEDLRHFKEKTMGYPIIMGRKTYESIGRPLKGRRNMVLSKSYPVERGIEVYGSVESVLEELKKSDYEKAYVIGGERVCREVLPIVDFLDITRVHRSVEGDAHFPEISSSEWEEVSRENRGDFSFLHYVRR